MLSVVAWCSSRSRVAEARKGSCCWSRASCPARSGGLAAGRTRSPHPRQRQVAELVEDRESAIGELQRPLEPVLVPGLGEAAHQGLERREEHRAARLDRLDAQRYGEVCLPDARGREEGRRDDAQACQLAQPSCGRSRAGRSRQTARWSSATASGPWPSRSRSRQSAVSGPQPCVGPASAHAAPSRATSGAAGLWRPGRAWRRRGCRPAARTVRGAEATGRRAAREARFPAGRARRAGDPDARHDAQPRAVYA